MKFDLENKRKFMSHLLLEDLKLCDKVANTSLWEEGEVLEAKLQINGVDVPAEHLESFMKGLWDNANEQLRDKYDVDGFEQRVDNKAKQLLKDHAESALDQLHELTDKLNNIGDVLKPHWER